MKINIRSATLSDAKYLYGLASDPLTRENSFDSNPIKWSEHLNWLSEKLENANSDIFIFSSGEKLIGTVRFEKKEESVISVIVDPKFRGKGIGPEIIKIGCKHFWENNQDDIFAYIKTKNVRSIKSFNKASFKFDSTLLIKGIDSVRLKAKKNDI